MTGHDQEHDVHALSGAYAVDALDTEEKARFEEHLRGCATCSTEVAELRDTAALLAADADVAPPAGLRERVLAGIETVRPLPPLAPPGDPDPIDTADAIDTADPAVAAPTRLADRRRRGLGGFRLGGPHLLVAAALVLVALAGVAAWRPWSDPAPERSLSAVERVLQAEDAERVTEELPDGSRATVVVSPSQGSGVIVTEDMALAPAGKVYQLWLATPAGRLESAGLMPDDPDATVLLEGDAARATGVGITVEPDGGSKQPTTKPIAFLDVELG